MRERRPGVWELRIHLHRDESGRLRQRSVSVHGDRAHAVERLAELVDEVERTRPKRVQPARASAPRAANSALRVRLPFAPLEALAAGGRPRHLPSQPGTVCEWCGGSAVGRCVTVGAIAERLGIYPEQVRRWRGHGLPATQADRLAVAVGLVPDLVWGPAWDG